MAIYKRNGSKYYWFKFTFDGELIQRSSKCTNKPDARKVESAYHTQLALGKVGIKPKVKAPKFNEAVKDFLRWSKTNHGESSRKRYSFACNSLSKFFKKTKTSKIKKKDIEKFIEWRLNQTSRKTGKGITRETVNRELMILKQIFRRLIEDNSLVTNPSINIKYLPPNDATFHVITEKEESLYVLAVPQPLQDVFVLMLETGMRCGEIYRIKRSEVFTDKGFLKVTKGKTKSSIRRVHLSIKANKILSARLKRFDGEYLFPQYDIDGNSHTKTLDYFHRKTVRKLGFDFRLYDARHTFATRILETGEIDLITLASILGHSDLKMVTRYAHPSEERKADAIKKMERKRVKAV